MADLDKEYGPVIHSTGSRAERQKAGKERLDAITPQMIYDKALEIKKRDGKLTYTAVCRVFGESPSGSLYIRMRFGSSANDQNIDDYRDAYNAAKEGRPWMPRNKSSSSAATISERTMRPESPRAPKDENMNMELLHALSNRISAIQRGLRRITLFKGVAPDVSQIDNLSYRCGDMVDEIEDFRDSLSPDGSSWDDHIRHQIYVRKLNVDILERDYIELLRKTVES